MPARSSVLLSLATLTLVAACGTTPAPPPAAAAPAKHVDPAAAGAITGRVVFEGTPPTPAPLKMSADPTCLEESGPHPHSDAVLVNKAGDVENVFVYVKDGLDAAYAFDVPTTPVQIDQKGCRYEPRVTGVRVGQPIQVVNDDPVFHNVHVMPQMNQEFDQGEPVQGSRLTHVFTVPEVMVHLKCDVHIWMSGYVGVVANPYFAVTGADGTFAIKNLPPGSYTLEAWHEQFGTRTQQVTVGNHQTQNVSFTFTAGRS